MATHADAVREAERAVVEAAVRQAETFGCVQSVQRAAVDRTNAAADRLLADAQRHVEALRAANDDSQYGLLKSAHEHIIAARGDLDADLK